MQPTWQRRLGGQDARRHIEFSSARALPAVAFGPRPAPPGWPLAPPREAELLTGIEAASSRPESCCWADRALVRYSPTDTASRHTLGRSMPLRSPEYWRNFAEEARTLAENMGSIESRGAMLEIARLYDILAARSKRFPDVPEPPKARRV